MANQLGIVHPELLTTLTPSFYPSLCTVQSDGASRTSSGAAGTPAWANVTGLVSLPCRMAPATQTDREVMATAGIYAVQLHVVALAGYYPTITEKQQALIDGVAHEIMFARHDGQTATSWLYVRKVT